MRRFYTCVLICLFAAAVAVSAWPAPAKGGIIKWRLATPWPTGIPLYTDMAELFAKNVEVLSNGRLIFRVYPAKAIVPPFEITESVHKGIIEVGHNWPGYDIGRDPTTAILGGYAGGMESVPMLHWLYTGGGKELWYQFRLERFGVIAFPCGIRPPEVFAHSHKPIKTLEDFKGLKMRTVGAWAQILPKLGASVVSLPGGEVYQALERKVIDATEWATPGENVISGFHEIAKYIIVPGAHQPCAPFEVEINKRKWDSLDDHAKKIIEYAAELTTFQSWYRIGKLDMGAMEVFKKTGNVIIHLSPEVQSKAHELGKEWAKEIAKTNPWFKKVMESQDAFEAKWKAVGDTRYLEYK